MNPTLLDIAFAALLLALNVALFAWVRQGLAEATARRMMRMMDRAGLHVATLARIDPPTRDLIVAARRSCRRCRTEAMCERWCAGEVEGDNGFCPNARAFRALAGDPRAAA